MYINVNKGPGRMKRFSSKRSLSNCQTGVRETVNLIFKHFEVKLIMMSALVAVSAHAEPRDGRTLSSDSRRVEQINYCAAGVNYEKDQCDADKEMRQIARNRKESIRSLLECKPRA